MVAFHVIACFIALLQALHLKADELWPGVLHELAIESD